MPRIPLWKRQKVVELSVSNKSTREIAAALNMHASTVGYIVRRHAKTGVIENLPKSGRPSKLTKSDALHLVIESKRDPTKSAKQLRSDTGLSSTVSISTIKRALRQNNLFGRIALKKPCLTQRLKSKRKQWCQEKMRWSVTDWEKVIFTDECKLSIHSKRRLYIRRNIGKRLVARYIQSTVKFSPSIMVWGAIRADGERYIFRTNNNVDSMEYQRILESALPVVYNSRHIFQQDGAPCHRSVSTSNYLTEKRIRILQNWPPQSPDLSPIENVWDILKNKLARCTISDVNQLWEFAQAEFNAIPTETIKKLFESMPRRLRAVVQAKGGHTKY